MTQAITLKQSCPFIVGQIYYGSLGCAHGSFPMVCVRRTAKSVWFEHAVRPEHYPLRRCKVRPYTSHNGWEQESASYNGWWIDSGTAVDPAAQHQDY
tara:strand:+ start:190 stop:480 length:291 start_codon:yes stop_codon:yes gene_type:complete